jgi:hypothetical protein
MDVLGVPGLPAPSDSDSSVMVSRSSNDDCRSREVWSQAIGKNEQGVCMTYLDTASVAYHADLFSR